jgi:hypothetical protein
MADLNADQIADIEYLCSAAEAVGANALCIDGCASRASVSHEHLNDLRAALICVQRHVEALRRPKRDLGWYRPHLDPDDVTNGNGHG